MSELLTCPFCGGEVEHQLMYDGAYSFTCQKCGLNARWADDIARAVPEMIEGTEKKWNTRYERTCKATVVYDKRFNEYTVRLSCGHEYSTPNKDDIVNYCWHCGAKVVDDE